MASEKLPNVDTREAELPQLPVRDEAVDLFLARQL
jgi:hypothetical protein